MKKHIDLANRTILVTGGAGFIGASLILRLLKEMPAGTIVNIDNINDYYDTKLKDYRLAQIDEAAKTSSANRDTGRSGSVVGLCHRPHPRRPS